MGPHSTANTIPRGIVTGAVRRGTQLGKRVIDRRDDVVPYARLHNARDGPPFGPGGNPDTHAGAPAIEAGGGVASDRGYLRRADDMALHRLLGDAHRIFMRDSQRLVQDAGGVQRVDRAYERDANQPRGRRV